MSTASIFRNSHNETLTPATRWLSFLLPLFLLTFRLGGAPLFNVDEGAFAEATREMFERGDFLSTWLNGAPRFDKPILIYWLQAIFFWLLHGQTWVSEWAFRLPSAIAAALWCHAIAVFAAPRFGRNAALMACGIAATSFGVFAIGRAATADALLNLLITLTLFDAWRALEMADEEVHATSAIASKPWLHPLHRAYFWIALGVLAKGPIAILIPVAVVLLHGLLNRSLPMALRLFFNLRGWLIFIVVAVPWYAAALAIHGQAFIDGFILRHNVDRFSGPLQGHSGGISYYLVIVPLLLLPWLPYFIAALIDAPRALMRDDDRSDAPGQRRLNGYLWLWIIFVLAFFSLSGTKLPHYALYGCTPLFLLCGTQWQRVRRAWIAGLPMLIVIALIIGLPELLAHAQAAGWIKDVFYQQQLLRADAALPGAYRLITIAALVLCVVVLMWRAKPVWQRALFAAAITTLLLAGLVTPWLGGLIEGPVQRAALFARTQPELATLWNFHMPSFSVYRQRVTPLRAPQPGELALTRIDRLPADAPVDVLYREGDVVLVRLHLSLRP